MAEQNISLFEDKYIPDRGIREMFFTYRGRVNRKRFLLRYSLLLAIHVIAKELLNTPSTEEMYALTALILLFPTVMLGIRRAHDIGKSGWWMLLSLIPIVNLIWDLVLVFKAGTPGPNKFGPDPLTDTSGV